MSYLTDIWSRILRYADSLGPQHWVYILIAVLVVGGFMLRGFGSRKHF
jgi:hypothetical protein